MAANDVAPILREIVLNVDDDNYCYEIAPQGDGRNRFLDIKLMDKGNPYTIPSGATVILEGKNAGGYNIFNSCTIQGSNIVRAPLTNGVLSFAGEGEYRISVYVGSLPSATFNIHLFVTEAPYDVIRLQASDAYEALTNLIKAAGEVVTWYISSGVPSNTIGDTEGDFCLNTNNGDIYHKVKKTNPSTGVDILEWDLFNGVNIKEKIYIRYSQYSDGKDPSTGADSYTKEPFYISGGNTIYQKYIGIFTSIITNEDSTGGNQDYNLVVPGTSASDYKWTLINNQITNSLVEYCSSTNGTTAPSTGWTTSIPTVSPGTFLWTRSYIEYENGYNSTTYSVAKHSTSISSVSTSYCVDSQCVNAPTGVTWQPLSAITLTPGKYLWTRFEFVQDDAAATTTYRYIVNKNTVSLSNIVCEYGESASDTSATGITTWSSTPVTVTPGKYLWTRYTFSLDDGSSPIYGYSVSKKAVSIKQTNIRYALSNQGTDATKIPPYDWSTSIPSSSTVGTDYLWTEVVAELDDGTTLSPFYSVGGPGSPADFGSISAKISDTAASPSISVTSSGPSTAKNVAFDFKIRAGKWFSGTDLSGTGDSNGDYIAGNPNNIDGDHSIVGDMYINTSGLIYICTAATAGGSATWHYITDIASVGTGYMTESKYAQTDSANGYVDKSLLAKEAIELTNTIIVNGTVGSDGTLYCDNANIVVGSDYDISFFVSNFDAQPTKCEIKVNPTTNDPSVYLEFSKAYASTKVKVKLRKI